MSPVETILGPITAELTTEVLDPKGVKPIHIIRITDGWQLKVNWTAEGNNIAAVLNPNMTWHVQAYLESIGPQLEAPPVVDEIVLFNDGVIPGDLNKLEYSKSFNVAPNKPAEAGVYKLVTVLTCAIPPATPGPLAGFDEGPLLQFYVA